MRIERKRLRDLVPASYNPRKDLKPGDRKYQEIKESLDRFGYVDPIVWNERTNHIVGGHQRLKVLLQENVEEAEVSVVDCDEATEMAMNLALNNQNEWDDDKLGFVLGQLEDFTGTGFDAEDLDAMRSAVNDDLDHRDPSAKNLRDLTLCLTTADQSGMCCMAVSAGMDYGTQSGRGICPLAKQRSNHALRFMDCDYFNYDHGRHREDVLKHKPRFATVRDMMTRKQCEAANIPYFSTDQILRWAEELEDGAENVILIPKFPAALREIPEKYVVGYSVPTSHGGTTIPFADFKGRRIHLLGGSPQTQWDYFNAAPQDVVSIDNNYIMRMATFGQWFDCETMAFRYVQVISPKTMSAMMAALTLSVTNMASMFGREHREAATIDALAAQLAADPTPLTRLLLAALSLSMRNVAELFQRPALNDATSALTARGKTEV